MTTRRTFMARTGGFLLAALTGRWLSGQATAGPGTPITVFKDPSCGCCTKWVDHLQANGFKPTVRPETNMDAIKDRLAIPKSVRGCHTAQLDGYLIEGHVPAGDIRRLLADRPKVAGLAVPGMPVSSPGMAVPGGPVEPFDVVAFQSNGTTRRFARH